MAICILRIVKIEKPIQMYKINQSSYQNPGNVFATISQIDNSYRNEHGSMVLIEFTLENEKTT